MSGLTEEIPIWLRMKIAEDWLVYHLDKQTLHELAPLSDVMAALMLASARFPLKSQHAEWYRYCFTQIMDECGKDISSELRFEELSEYSMGELNGVRRQLYNRRVRSKAIPIIPFSGF